MSGGDEESGSDLVTTSGAGRKTAVGLVLFAVVAALAWWTMEPGKPRTLVLVVLGGFALRVVLGSRLPARVR